MKKIINLKIDGMRCAHCANHAREALQNIDGVLKVKVDLENAIAKVVENRDIPFEEFSKAISEAGYVLVSIQ